MQKTYSPKASELESSWYLVDAQDQVLGRLASNIAKLLRGKHKPGYTPHVNTGDFVVVINARHVRVTGNKAKDKLYKRYSGFPGGLKQRTFEEQMGRQPEKPLTDAVKGMLQHNTLGAQMLKRLRVYADGVHEQQAQRPTRIRFNDKGEMENIGD